MIWRWLNRLTCFHSWDFHVTALPKSGEPDAWKRCRTCGKVTIYRFW